MGIETAWNWNEVNSKFWDVPSEEVYYYLTRWKGLGYKSFLDIGCGIGRHSLFFAQSGFDVTAIDISSSGITALNKKAEEMNLKLESVVADSIDMPFSDKSFECILAFHSVYHTDAKGFERIINEIHRVMKVGGEFYITLISKAHPDFSNDNYVFIDSNTKMKPEEDGSVLPHYFVEYSEISALFDKFEILKVRHIQDFFDDKTGWHFFIHGRKVRDGQN